MTAKLEKNVVRSEQNSEQFNKDRASARTIESGVENLQRILCRFRCTLLCLKSELSQPNPQNEIVSYCKNNESVDENDENRSFLAAELLKTIQKQLTRKNHYTKTFANKFCRYRLNNQTLNKLVHVFNSSYKAGMIELPDNDYRDAVAQMAEAQKQIETGQDELIQRHQGLVSNLYFDPETRFVFVMSTNGSTNSLDHRVVRLSRKAFELAWNAFGQ